MTLEEVKKAAREAIKETIETELDSSMIFIYIQHLENEVKRLTEELKKKGE